METRFLRSYAEQRVRDCAPVSLLSPARAAELGRALRPVELRWGESYQVRAERGRTYLAIVEGQVDLIEDALTRVHLMPSGQATRLLPLAPSPKTTMIVAVEDSFLALIDSEQIDHLLFWDAMLSWSEQSDPELRGWLGRVNDTLAFRYLRAESLSAAFRAMSPVGLGVGDEPLSAGRPADACYLLTSGRAEVRRRLPHSERPVRVGEMQAGDCFGIESLFSHRPSELTVCITEGATAMRLTREQAERLIWNESVDQVPAQAARDRLAEDYRLIDVRTPEEYCDSHIPGAVQMPLSELNERIAELDPGQRYLAYCWSGRRSAVAAGYLREHGYQTASLSGGLRDWPYETAGSPQSAAC